MRKQKAAPRTLQRRRAKGTRGLTSNASISQFDLGAKLAGILIAVSFGLMFFAGLM